MSLEVQNLRFSYDGRPVFRDLSFRAEYGQIHAFLGRNGAGKSTLFKCILGLLPFSEGKILLDGLEIKAMRAQDLARRIAFIPQKQNGSFPYTVWEMVLMGTHARLRMLRTPGAAEAASVRAALERLELTEFADRRYDRISGGEQQLVLLARALAQQSRVLVLDEPTSDLDLGHRLQVMRCLRRLAADGYMILLSTHNPQQVFTYADQVMVLQQGEIREQGAPRDVLTESCLTRLYGVGVRLHEISRGEMAVLSDAADSTQQ